MFVLLHRRYEEGWSMLLRRLTNIIGKTSTATPYEHRGDLLGLLGSSFICCLKNHNNNNEEIII